MPEGNHAKHERDHIERPINAATAARGAAHARSAEAGSHYRRAAAGVGERRGRELDARAASAGGRTNHAAVVASAIAGVALAAALIFFVGDALMNVLLFDDAERVPASRQAAIEGGAAVESPSQACVDADGAIDYMGNTHTVQKLDDGAWHFCYQTAGDDGAEALSYFTITGDPVGFALYQGVFFVVSNADGSWHIQSFVPGDGSAAADYRSDTGTVESIALDGSELELTEAGGRTYTLDLEE